MFAILTIPRYQLEQDRVAPTISCLALPPFGKDNETLVQLSHEAKDTLCVLSLSKKLANATLLGQVTHVCSQGDNVRRDFICCAWSLFLFCRYECFIQRCTPLRSFIIMLSFSSICDVLTSLGNVRYITSYPSYAEVLKYILHTFR